MSDQTTSGAWGEPVPPQEGQSELRRRRPLHPGATATSRAPTAAREPATAYRSGTATGRTVYPRTGAEPAMRVGRKERRRVRIVEHFSGGRVRAHVSVWRKTRSIIYLVIIGAILVAATAAVLAAIVAGIAVGFHHLSKGG
jgi:hypothetical protein